MISEISFLHHRFGGIFHKPRPPEFPDTGENAEKNVLSEFLFINWLTNLGFGGNIHA